ncbi:MULTISPECIES: AbrB/MazE/SpoVT family DNA-binding domain-containing protein [Lacticaseibacillus]|uniref:AbrB/MazE/SpoVT family DNA-binding domain-containing protein n=1 Tax=Lacticaseibacillus TaxID=2759736 RepID=UPI00069B8589|nr:MULTISPECIES: type II toxin-antitoxin system PrlF family antitoxin [Lacticaseibacillus]
MVTSKHTTLAVAKMTSKHQITIPKVVREKLGLTDHDKLVFQLTDHGQVMIDKEQKSDLWSIIREQDAAHGSIDTPESDWGKDVGAELIDD